MAKFGRMEGHRNADRFLADTYGLLYQIFDAEVVRVEIRLGFVVSLRPKRAAFGQAGSTRLDSTICAIRYKSTRMYSPAPSQDWGLWHAGRFHSLRKLSTNVSVSPASACSVIRPLVHQASGPPLIVHDLRKTGLLGQKLMFLFGTCNLILEGWNWIIVFRIKSVAASRVNAYHRTWPPVTGWPPRVLPSGEFCNGMTGKYWRKISQQKERPGPHAHAKLGEAQNTIKYMYSTFILTEVMKSRYV